LSYSDLNGTIFKNANLKKADLRRCTIQKTNLDNASFNKTRFWN
jgi:uncharacterized protein YjbI with pentapeptide repeats